MGYSKETTRQNEILGDLLAGRTPEKRIMVGYEGERQKQGDIKSKLTDIMAEVRMPWFCPSCKKVMKKRLDNKFWRLFQHCFNCQIDIEHELRTTGKFKQYEAKKVYENRRSSIIEQIESIKNWKKQTVSYVEPVNVDTGYTMVENYEVPKELINEANEAIKNLKVTLKTVEVKIEECNAE